ncbi:MAG: hypothetical protein RR216_02395 [Pseudoflavonifractor sp.]
MEEKQQVKNSNKMFLALTALVAVLLVCIGLYFMMKPKQAATEGAINITVTVVHGDAATKEFKLTTDKPSLGEALVEGKVVVDNQSTYGLYILTADGETADEAKQEWWCITKGGESLTVGASEQPIADGEQYELTLTTGYDS